MTPEADIEKNHMECTSMWLQTDPLTERLNGLLIQKNNCYLDQTFI